MPRVLSTIFTDFSAYFKANPINRSPEKNHDKNKDLDDSIRFNLQKSFEFERYFNRNIYIYADKVVNLHEFIPKVKAQAI